jgi:hypothetical protein
MARRLRRRVRRLRRWLLDASSAWSGGAGGPEANALLLGLVAAGHWSLIALEVAWSAAKVALMLALELGAAPLLLGVWLDLMALPLSVPPLPPLPAAAASSSAALADADAARLAAHRAAAAQAVAARAAALARSPLLSAAVHWLAGILLVLAVSYLAMVAREVLRPGALPRLRDPLAAAAGDGAQGGGGGGNNNPVLEMAQQPLSRSLLRLMAASAWTGAVCVFALHVPALAAHLLAPRDLLPLRLFDGGAAAAAAARAAAGGGGGGGAVLDPIARAPADVLALHALAPLLLERGGRLRHALKQGMRAWLRVAGAIVGLDGYLLPPPPPRPPPPPPRPAQQQQQQQRQQQQQQPEEQRRRQDPPANADNDPSLAVAPLVPPPPPSVEWFQARRGYGLRVAALALLAGASLSLLGFTLVTLPVLMGRHAFAALGVSARSDLYSMAAGLGILYGVSRAGYAAGRASQRRTARAAARAAAWRLASAGKAAVLVALWFGGIAFLAGALTSRVVVVPLRVPAHQSAVPNLPQIWVLGVLATKLGHVFAVVAAGGLRGAQRRLQRVRDADAAETAAETARRLAARARARARSLARRAAAAAAADNAAVDAAAATATAAAEDASRAAEDRQRAAREARRRARRLARRVSWLARAEALQHGGLRGLRLRRALRQVVFPAASRLLAALAVPHLIAAGLLPFVPGFPASVLRAGLLHSHSAAALAAVAVLLARRCHSAWLDLHDAVRDDLYLIGRRLLDHPRRSVAVVEPDAGASASAAPPPPAAAADEVEEGDEDEDDEDDDDDGDETATEAERAVAPRAAAPVAAVAPAGG